MLDGVPGDPLEMEGGEQQLTAERTVQILFCFKSHSHACVTKSKLMHVDGSVGYTFLTQNSDGNLLFNEIKF